MLEGPAHLIPDCIGVYLMQQPLIYIRVLETKKVFSFYKVHSFFVPATTENVEDIEKTDAKNSEQVKAITKSFYQRNFAAKIHRRCNDENRPKCKLNIVSMVYWCIQDVCTPCDLVVKNVTACKQKT